jgi:hypothetical protein
MFPSLALCDMGFPLFPAAEDVDAPALYKFPPLPFLLARFHSRAELELLLLPPLLSYCSRPTGAVADPAVSNDDARDDAELLGSVVAATEVVVAGVAETGNAYDVVPSRVTTGTG